jgi:hypothetical protein
MQSKPNIYAICLLKEENENKYEIKSYGDYSRNAQINQSKKSFLTQFQDGYHVTFIQLLSITVMTYRTG